MKRTLTTLIILFFTFSLFSETGYGKIQWNETKEKVKEKIGTYKIKDLTEKERNLLWDSIVTTEKVTGKLGEKIYFFQNDCLVGIGYITNHDNLKNSDFGSYNNHRKINGATKEQYKQKYQELYQIENEQLMGELEVLNLWSKTFDFELLAENIEIETDLYPETKTAYLYIYDYNDDTRVYIYDNIIKDQAIVVYVPHEQDY